MSKRTDVPYLKLLPCFHYWLAVQYNTETVIALCKRCQRKGIFQYREWNELKSTNEALDKPKRV